MPKLNLLRAEICDDIEVEEFIDVISDNCTQEGTIYLTKDALLPPGSINYFGNGCAIEARSHQQSETDTIWSEFFLHTQAQEFLKITIRFAVDEEGNLDKQELYFTDDLTEDEEEEFEYDNCGEGVSDPRHNGHWAEWLTDMGINKNPYEDE